MLKHYYFFNILLFLVHQIPTNQFFIKYMIENRLKDQLKPKTI